MADKFEKPITHRAYVIGKDRWYHDIFLVGFFIISGWFFAGLMLIKDGDKYSIYYDAIKIPDRIIKPVYIFLELRRKFKSWKLIGRK